MTVFEKNIQAVAEKDRELADLVAKIKKFPRIERETGECGRVTLNIEGPDGRGVLHFPDIHPPQLGGSIEKIGRARMVAILGFGSGSLLGEAVARTPEQTFILLIEPDIDLFAAVLREVDISSILGLERVSLSVGETFRTATFARAENEFGVFTLSDFSIVENPWSARLYRSYFNDVKRELEQLKKFGGQNVIAMEHLGPKWRDNIFENLSSVIESPPVASLFRKYKGVPAITVAAGPSLDKNAFRLAAIKGKGIIIAVDTAVRSLLAVGVTPDIIVALDAKHENYFHLAGLNLPDTLMVLNPVVHPKIVKESVGPKVFVGYAHPLLRWIETLIGDLGTIRTGGSVATSAFDLALKMGCSPIIMVGQDMVYVGTSTHATGSVQNVLNRASVDTEEEIGQLFDTHDIFGRKARTSEKMETWRRWFEIIVAQSGACALNATEGGASINGVDNVCLAEAMARFCSGDDAGFSAPVCESGNVKRELVEALKEVRVQARRVKNSSGQGLAIVKNVMLSLPEGSPKNIFEAMEQLGTFLNDILEMKTFSEVNRWDVDSAIDSVEDSLRAVHGINNENEKLKAMLNAYLGLFNKLYGCASGFEKSASGVLRELEKGEHKLGVGS
ncbi:Motility accessory factor [hydrothermal vent metagenome]|uniref:Motility accessory factor n=1 Tax=hydrothermal vent metagenome TaxID=652676 RepID=A0A3B1BKP8_9ZZZZ